MQREEFERLVVKAIDGLPAEFKGRLENIDVVIEDWPTPRQLAKVKARGRYALLGLYEGVPHTHRDRGYNLILPDRITIFQKPIEALCRSEAEMDAEIRRVVRHEIAHHFGISDRRLRAIEGEI